MNNNRKGMGRKIGALLLALTLAAMMPLMVLAETAPDTATADTTGAATAQWGGAPQQGGGTRGQGMDTEGSQTLTAEQQTAYDAALALYRQIEDAVLMDLVAAGAVTQADADAYTALRANAGALDELDTGAWTALQYKAYYEALQKTGDERKAAVQALADAGQLTQAQADALTGGSASGLWQSLGSNAGTNSAVRTALETLRQASQTLRKTLRDAGIYDLDRSDRVGSLAQNGVGGGMRNGEGGQNAPGFGDGEGGQNAPGFGDSRPDHQNSGQPGNQDSSQGNGGMRPEGDQP